MAEGVTTLEIKSGYGLSRADEARCLAVARRLGRELPLTVRTTSLGAHALPPEFDGRADDYIDALMRWLPGSTPPGWSTPSTCSASASPSRRRRPSACSRRAALGLPVKLHAEQLSDQGGARWPRASARCPATTSSTCRPRACRPMAPPARGRAAARRLLLPARDPAAAGGGAARGRRAHRHGHRPQPGLVAGAVAAADAQHGLHAVPPDARRSLARRHRARGAALGLPTAAVLRAGQRADFVVWDAEHPREMAYRFGHNPCRRVWFGGVGEPLMHDTETYTLHRGTRPLLVSLPHVGTHIPETCAALRRARLRVEDTDWHLEPLYAFARELGASLLVPRCSRYVIDLNRPPDNQPMYPGAATTPSCARRASSPATRCTATARRPTRRGAAARGQPTGSPTTTRWPPNWRA
jgi:hypothetical protein